MDVSRQFSRSRFVGGALAAVAALGGMRLPTAAAAPATAARWRRLSTATSPPARSDHGLAFDAGAGIVYLHGGRRGGRPLGDLWAFDVRGGIWSAVEPGGDGPAPRSGHLVVHDAARRRLVVAFGRGSDGAPLADAWTFEIEARAWRRLPGGAATRPEGRFGAGAAHDVAADRLLVTHGRGAAGDLDDTWELDLRSGSWRRVTTRSARPSARGLVHGAWDGGDGEAGRLLLFGGGSRTARFLGDLWSLEPGTGAWRRLDHPRSPRPRARQAAAVDARRRRWFVFGGITAAGLDGDLWVYRAGLQFWSRVALVGQRPSATQGAGLVVAGDRILLFGGHDGRSALADTWMLPLLTIA